MPFFIAAGVGSLVSAGASMWAADEASDAQREAARRAERIERENNAQIRSDFAPYREAGGSALTKYADSLGLNGDAAREDFRTDFRADPGYQFSFDEGTRAVQGSAAAKGGLLSGGAMRALTRYGTGLADQQYGSYLDRFKGLADTGLNAAAQTGSFGAQSAGRQGQYALDAGAAQAGGYLGMAQGVNGAISNGLQLAGRYAGQQGGGGYNPYSSYLGQDARSILG